MSERFTVYSDQASLRWLLTITEPSGRLTRWRLRLSEFDFEVKYKKGASNTQADALSRLQTLGETTSDLDDEIPCFIIEGDTVINQDHLDFISHDYAEHDALLLQSERDDSEILIPITADELVRAQSSDRFCQSIRAKLDGGEDVPFADDANGYLTRTVEAFPQIVVPTELQPRILHMHHYAKLSGHPGGRKLYHSLRRHFYWPSMAVHAYGTVKNCTTCAKNRVTLRKNAKQMHLFPATSPLEFVSIDILGELITTARGNRFLLVITDRFSKLVRTVPLKRITSAIIAREFVRHWVFVYGPPAFLLSDNGGQFTARFFQDVCRILGIKNLFTTTYHPQCNGQVERFNRTILAALRHYVADHPKNWDLFTDALTYAYNGQSHSSTGLAPFEIVLSRCPPAVSLQVEPVISDTVSVKHHMIKWKKWPAALMSTAKDQLAKRQAKYKLDFDRRLRRYTENIRVGDRVFVRKDYSNPKVERKHKLSPVATGPYDVVEVNRDTVVIETDKNIRERLSRDRVTLAPRVVDDVPRHQDSNAQTQDANTRTQTVSANTPVTPTVPSNTAANRGLADLPTSISDDPPRVHSRVWVRRPIPPSTTHPCVSEQQVTVPGTNATALHPHLDEHDATADEHHDVDDEDAELGDYDDEQTARRPITRSQTRRNAPSPSQDVQPEKRTEELSEDTNNTPNLEEITAQHTHLNAQPMRKHSPLSGTTDLESESSQPQTRAESRTRTEQRDTSQLASESGQEIPISDVTQPINGLKNSATIAVTPPSNSPSDLDGGDGSRQLRRSARLQKRYTANDAELDTPSSDDNRKKNVKRKVTFATPEAVVVDDPQTPTSGDDTGYYSQKYVVDKILAHGYSPTGELIHQVRWYGYDSDGDTWQPTRDIPRNTLVRYYRRKRLPLPPNINEAQDG